MSTAVYEGLSVNASDLVKIMSWANNDPKFLTRVYLRFPRALRINESMVTKLLDEEHRIAHPERYINR